MWFLHVPVKIAGQVINNIVTNWAPAVLTDWEQRPAVGFVAAAVCVSKCITMPFGELIGCVFIRFRVPFFCCNASSTSGVKPYRSMVLFALFFPFTRISMTVPTVTCVELHNFVEATAWRGFSSSQS